mmetsp:Transcript_13038/g.28717  ORF Transcript_13038/g.28717 Transcript_13038/m.28717 type:complete len:202 (+) Transcript_13038:251-856(+)
MLLARSIFLSPVGSVTLTPARRQALQVLVPFCAASQEESRASFGRCSPSTARRMKAEAEAESNAKRMPPARILRPTRRRRNTGHTKSGKQAQHSAAFAGSSGSLKSRTVSSMMPGRAQPKLRREAIVAFSFEMDRSSALGSPRGASHAAANSLGSAGPAGPAGAARGRGLARRQTLANSSCKRSANTAQYARTTATSKPTQ